MNYLKSVRPVMAYLLNPVENSSLMLLVSMRLLSHVGVYTCGKYTFLVGINGDSFFLVDTHPIGEELGGNGNGILVAAHDTGNRSCKLLVQWIMKRLLCSGVVPRDAQSFAWLMEYHKQGL